MPPSSTDTTEEFPTAVGPGAISHKHDDQPSKLDGVTEYEWVDLYNPLTVTFSAQVASSRPVNAPVKVYQSQGLQSGIRTESDLATQYGLTGFKNPDHPSNVHVPHIIEISAGATRRFPGNEAQVVLRQLVGYMLQIEGKGLKLADPFERSNMEDRLIRGRGSIQDLMETPAVSVRDQMSTAIDRSNNNLEPTHASPAPTEVEFPDVSPSNAPRATATADAGRSDASGQAEIGDPLRPKV